MDSLAKKPSARLERYDARRPAEGVVADYLAGDA
jgi:hypothetical protein